jgi:BlaI family penicillinase repressor
MFSTTPRRRKSNRSVRPVASPVPQISDAELDVLKALWAGGPGTVRDVEARLRRRRKKWAYTTLLTLLSRLRDKGFVSSDRATADKTGGTDDAAAGRGGPALVFTPIVTRERLLRDGLADLADRVCDGTASPLVHALVAGTNLTSDDIADLRKLLDDLERKG